MNKTTRILMLSPFFAPHIGGSQRYMEELATTLIKTQKHTTVDVLTYNTTNAPRRQTYRGMTIYRIGCIPILPGQFVLPNPFELIPLLTQLSHHRYTAVWANTRFFDTAWWGWIFAHMIGATSIITDHVAGHPIHAHPVITWMAKVIDRTVCRFALRKYDVVTATNKATQRFLHATLKIPNVILSYGGVDTQYFSPAPKRIRKIPGLSKIFHANDIVITFASRLIWSKGVTYFLHAITQFLQKAPAHVYVVFAGNGDLQEMVRTTITTHNLSDRVFLTGGLSPGDVRTTLRASDIVVHPSHHTEGFPNVLLEAGACGACIIATHNAGTSEIVQHNSTGLLFPPRDSKAILRALTWTLTHKKQRTLMAKRARAHIARHFAWKNIVKDFICIF